MVLLVADLIAPFLQGGGFLSCFVVVVVCGCVCWVCVCVCFGGWGVFGVVCLCHCCFWGEAASLFTDIGYTSLSISYDNLLLLPLMTIIVRYIVSICWVILLFSVFIIQWTDCIIVPMDYSSLYTVHVIFLHGDTGYLGLQSHPKGFCRVCTEFDWGKFPGRHRT